MAPNKRIPQSMWLLLALALGLRLWGAWRGELIYDESAHLALSETIHFHPDRFHLVFRTLDHPLLSVYVLKLSGALFGTSDFGLRILHVLSGTATVLVIFLIARAIVSERAGLWAAAWLATDQFHASWSRSFMPEVLMLCFSALSLWTFLRLLEHPRTRDALLLGLFMGLAYLGKETGILVIPILWTFLMVTKEHRSILFTGWWYAAHGVFLAVIAPDLIWNLANFSESYLHRDASMISQGFQIQLKSFSLYVGELFRILIDPNILDDDYKAANLYACHWPAGVAYLIMCGAAIRRWNRPPERLLIVAFLFVFVFFTLLPGGRRFEPFWWASLSLLPAIVLTARECDTLAARHRVVSVLVWLGMCYLAVHCGMELSRPGTAFPRQSAEQFALGSIEMAKHHLAQHDFEPAEKSLIYALNIGGPNADAYYLLALLHLDQGDRDGAVAYLLKSQRLAPESRLVEEALRKLREAEP